MEQVTLTSKEFKALSSENRAKILKLLLQQNHTLSEISKKLGLSSPSAKQHLEVLEQAQLIEQIDEGRKWKYYKLTKKGKQLLESKENQTQIFILISVAAVILVGGILLFSMQQSLIGQTQIPSQAGIESTPLDKTTTTQLDTTAPTSAIYELDLEKPQNLYTQSTALDCGKITKFEDTGFAKIKSCMNNAFGPCNRAKALRELTTIEGDKVITFIEIQGKENEKCKIFVHKASADQFGEKGNFELKCIEINSQDPFSSCTN